MSRWWYHKTQCKRRLQECALGYPEEFNEWPLGSSLYAHGRTQVANGNAARMVFYHYDFVEGSPQLNVRGRDKLVEARQVAPREFLSRRDRANTLDSTDSTNNAADCSWPNSRAPRSRSLPSEWSSGRLPPRDWPATKRSSFMATSSVLSRSGGAGGVGGYAGTSGLNGRRLVGKCGQLGLRWWRRFWAVTASRRGHCWHSLATSWEATDGRSDGAVNESVTVGVTVILGKGQDDGKEPFQQAGPKAPGLRNRRLLSRAADLSNWPRPNPRRAGAQDGRREKASLRHSRPTSRSLSAGSPRAQGMSRRPKRLIAQALKRDKTRGDAHLHLANMLTLKGEYRQAQEEYQKAIEANPGNADVFCDMGYSLYLQHKWDEAERNLKQAIAIDPNHRSCPQQPRPGSMHTWIEPRRHWPSSEKRAIPPPTLTSILRSASRSTSDGSRPVKNIAVRWQPSRAPTFSRLASARSIV